MTPRCTHTSRLALPLLALAVSAADASAQCEEAKLVASDGANADLFGRALALSEGRVLIGAWLDDDACPLDPDCNSGAAYIFDRRASGWVEVAKLTASDGTRKALFGVAVALDGDTAVVGAQQAVLGGVERGAAYVFERRAAGWVETARLRALDGAAGDRFGASLTISGGTIVVGAPGHDHTGYEDAGAAYVFGRTATGWEQAAKLLPTVAFTGDAFGAAVDVSGDTVLVGSPGEDHAGDSSGSVYVFRRASVGFEPEARLFAADADWHDGFGGFVSVSGHRALVGASGDDDGGSNSGAAYVFERSGVDWTQTAKLVALDAVSGDRFGSAGAVADGIAVVGAPFKDTTGFISGAAYVFVRGTPDWQHVARLVPGQLVAGDFLGAAVAVRGRTVAVGARGDDGTDDEAGAAYLFEVPDFAVPFGFCGQRPAPPTGSAVLAERKGPCGNPDLLAGCANSTGDGAELAACGGSSVVADDLLLVLAGLPAGEPVLLFMGAGTTRSLFGDGLLAVAAGDAGLFRFAARQAGVDGTLVVGPGLVAISRASFPAEGHLLAGGTWNFQGWYRDPDGPCGTGFNLSNALAVTFSR